MSPMTSTRQFLYLLGYGETCKSNTSTSAWRLVHLSEDKRDLGLAIKLDDTSLLHFVVEIVALAGSLAHATEHGETTMCLCNVVL